MTNLTLNSQIKQFHRIHQDSVNTPSLNADKASVSTLKSDRAAIGVTTSPLHTVFLPTGKILEKVTLYSPSTFTSQTTPSSMVTTPLGSTDFTWDEDVNVVAARLSRGGTPLADLGPSSATVTIKLDTSPCIDDVGVGKINKDLVQVNAFDGTFSSTLSGGLNFGGKGEIDVMAGEMGKHVIVEQTSLTEGSVVLDIYYYV